MLNLLDLSGQQFELNIFHFADLLSRLEVWGLHHRYYESGLLDTVKPGTDILVGLSINKPMIKIYKQLLNLEFVNEKREYALFIANPNASEDEWASITFTRDSVHSFLVETY